MSQTISRRWGVALICSAAMAAGCNNGAQNAVAPSPGATAAAPAAVPGASPSVQVAPPAPANAGLPPVDLSRAPVEAATGKVVDGAQFKAIFPGSQGGFDVRFGAAKAGYAGATLTQGAKKVADLSVSDLAAAPKKAEPYLRGPQLMGYPTLSGRDTSAILVGNRYAVQIRSLDPAFGVKDREQWLMKFKPSNLARIQ